MRGGRFPGRGRFNPQQNRRDIRSQTGSQQNTNYRQNQNKPRRVNPNLRCFICNQNHHVLDCPTVPESRRQQVFQERTTRRNPPIAAPATTTTEVSHSENQTAASSQASTIRTDNRTQAIRTNNNPNGTYLPSPHVASTVQSSTSNTILIYEKDVLLDSGATSHMTGNIQYLRNKQPYYQDVILADGSLSQSKFIGDIEVRVFDRKTRQNTAILLKQCIFVPGFRSTLWSVRASNQQGHRIILILML